MDESRKNQKTIKRDYGNIAGMMVQKNGTKLYENYFNGYTAANAVHVYSVTKSVFSALIGMAIDQGHIKSVDRKVLDFFPDYTVKTGEKTIQHITISHLLTMTAPYKYETEPYEKFFTSQNPMQDALDLLGGDKPIGTFNYSAVGGTHILSGILTRATGQPILDFAAENLFLPLGINVPRNVVLRSVEEYMAVMNDKNVSGWAVDPQGINTASWGPDARGYDKNRPTVSKQRYLGRETSDTGRVGRGKHKGTQPLERTRTILWLSMVDP